VKKKGRWKLKGQFVCVNRIDEVIVDRGNARGITEIHQERVGSPSEEELDEERITLRGMEKNAGANTNGMATK